MFDLLSDKEFLKPVAVVIGLLLALSMLRKVNKLLLIVGIAVISMLYLLNNRPPWLEHIWQMFQV